MKKFPRRKETISITLPSISFDSEDGEPHISIAISPPPPLVELNGVIFTPPKDLDIRKSGPLRPFMAETKEPKGNLFESDEAIFSPAMHPSHKRSTATYSPIADSKSYEEHCFQGETICFGGARFDLSPTQPPALHRQRLTGRILDSLAASGAKPNRKGKTSVFKHQKDDQIAIKPDPWLMVNQKAHFDSRQIRPLNEVTGRTRKPVRRGQVRVRSLL